VRLVAPGVVAGRFVGTVLMSYGDTLTLGSSNSAPIVLLRPRITSLELSRGKSHTDGAVRGAQWGTAVGLAFGAVTVGFVRDCYQCTADNPARSKGAWVGLNTLAGAGYGALIGAFIGRERWEQIDPSGHAAVGIHPGGASLALRHEF